MNQTVVDGAEQSHEVAQIESWYEELQRPFHLAKDLDSNLVTPVGSRSLPIHRWYLLKESYSSELPIWCVNRLQTDHHAVIRQVVDPFIGGGTTGVSLAEQGISVDGVEYNPFIHLVAQTKSEYPRLKKAEANAAFDTLRHFVQTGASENKEVPELSTFHNTEYFRPRDVHILSGAIAAINASGYSDELCRFFKLGVAAALERVANLRKDGRALRYTERPNRPTADIALVEQWQLMFDDIEGTFFSAPFRVESGTATRSAEILSGNTYDLALFSPPYLNNFDYSEIYKLELWMLRFVTSVEQWRSLRKGTLRSHPSIEFPQRDYPQPQQLSELYAKLDKIGSQKELLGDRNEVGKYLTGYFQDMHMVFLQMWELLRPGGFLTFVVANSRHKHLPVATDVILGEIARQIGFEPLELNILRTRNGRTKQKKYLRESAVIMRKPG